MEKVFVFGGAGFLGYNTILALLDKGYAVKTVDIVDLDPEIQLPDNVEYIKLNMFEKSDDEIVELIKGCDGFVYGGGVDERIVPEKPARKFFYEKNVRPTQRIARLAQRAGVKSFVLLGSYVSEFAERLTCTDYGKEPYPETRKLQEKVAFYEGEGSMAVSVLRLPYIFGTMEGKTPLWKMFVDVVKDQEYVPVNAGGSAMITAKQVGQCAVAALEKAEHRKVYPVATGFIKYIDFYQLIVEALGQEDQTTLAVTKYEDFLPIYEQMYEESERQGVEHGIREPMMGYANSLDFFLDTNVAKVDLGVEEEDLIEVIRETLKKCI